MFELLVLFVLGFLALGAVVICMKLLLWLIVLPFRALGWLFSGIGAILGGLLMLVLGIVVVGGLLPIFLIVLFPVFLLGGLVWGFFKLLCC